MKKMILLAAFALGAFVSHAQTASVRPIDTLGASVTDSMKSPVGYFKASDGLYKVSLVATKISGTPSATAKLMESTDGVNYTYVLSPYGNYVDSFNIANVSGAQVKNWNVRLRTVRMLVEIKTAAGTQSTQYKTLFLKN